MRNDPVSQVVSSLLFIGLCMYVWFGSLREEKEIRWTGREGMLPDAVLGIDTFWGGDVMCPSGTGRFIADSWFSDEPLPMRTRIPRRNECGSPAAWQARAWIKRH